MITAGTKETIFYCLRGLQGLGTQTVIKLGDVGRLEVFFLGVCLCLEDDSSCVSWAELMLFYTHLCRL